MKNFLNKLKCLIPTKRRLIQLYAALLTNANIKGFVNGSIYQGAVKNTCVPGLNCYSCPGAAAACPLGSLQNALASSKTKAPHYVIGIILLFGIILGRMICGFLCPFGLIQDLLYKIRTPKLKKNKITKILSYLKYVILVIFVVVLPLIYAFKDFPLPAFCKYICPAGTLGGAIGLLINPENTEMFGMLGPLFTWKFVLLVGFIMASVFIYRVFCRFFCPLGALYGLFNKIAILGIRLEKPKCTECGKCISTCKMDINEVGDHECISCGDCVSVCPTQAISYRGGKIILPANEIPEFTTSVTDCESIGDAEGNEQQVKNSVTKTVDYECESIGDAPDEAVERAAKRHNVRALVIKITAGVLAAALLVTALVYYNFIDKVPTSDFTDELPADEGNEIGNICYDYTFRLVGSDGELTLSDLRGKAVVINFWGTWCGPCCAELPHFNELASEYADSCEFVVIHSFYGESEAEGYINANFPNSEMNFVYDDRYSEESTKSMYYSMLAGVNATTYPVTFVLDAEGKITFSKIGGITYDALKTEIEKAIAAE